MHFRMEKKKKWLDMNSKLQEKKKATKKTTEICCVETERVVMHVCV